MYTFCDLRVNMDREEFKYLGKMTQCKKTQLMANCSMNLLERFMLESNMSPEEIQSIFQNENVSQLSYAFKRYAEHKKLSFASIFASLGKSSIEVVH